MLINISFGLFHNRRKQFLANFFRILQLCTRPLSSYDSDLGPFFSRLQLCTRLPSSYVSDLGPFCSRQLRGLPSSDGFFQICLDIYVLFHLLVESSCHECMQQLHETGRIY